MTVKVVTWITVTVTTAVSKTICEVVSRPVVYVASELQPLWCSLGIVFTQEDLLDLDDALLFARISHLVYDADSDSDAEQLFEGQTTEIDADLVFLDFFDEDSLGPYPVDTQVFVLEEPAADRLIVGFRGTEGTSSLVDWLNNLSAVPIPFLSVTDGVVHGGFLAAYTSVRSQLIEVVLTQMLNERTAGDSIRQICFTGHSLGGALATLASLDFRSMLSDEVEVVNYTFGAPRVGNPSIAFDYNGQIPNSFRLVNEGDPVPEFPIPGGTTKYRHVKHLVYVDDQGGMTIEPCPRPVYDWVSQLNEHLPPELKGSLPPEVSEAISGGVGEDSLVDALITLGISLADEFAQHDTHLYISNLEAQQS